VQVARIKHSEGGSVGLMATSPNAAILDAKTSPLEEECAGRMGRKICSKSAKMKTAQT
jgi:hypothetical protein